MVDGPNPIRNPFVNQAFTGDYKAPNPIFAERQDADEDSALTDFNFKFTEEVVDDMPKTYIDTCVSMATYTKLEDLGVRGSKG